MYVEGRLRDHPFHHHLESYPTTANCRAVHQNLLHVDVAINGMHVSCELLLHS
jgi:hypothetical protein